MANELMSMNEFGKILENVGDAYASMDLTQPENKVKLYNAINGASDKVSDLINREFILKDAVTVPATVVDEKTGEQRYIVRSILIDGEGNSYSCSSSGMQNSLRNILAIFGTLHFDEGLKVRVKQIETKRGRTFTIELV